MKKFAIVLLLALFVAVPATADPRKGKGHAGHDRYYHPGRKLGHYKHHPRWGHPPRHYRPGRYYYDRNGAIVGGYFDSNGNWVIDWRLLLRD